MEVLLRRQQIIVIIYPTVSRSGLDNRTRAGSFYDDWTIMKMFYSIKKIKRRLFVCILFDKKMQMFDWKCWWSFKLIYFHQWDDSFQRNWQKVGDEYDATLEDILYDDEQYYWTTDDIDQVVRRLVLKLRAAKLRQRAVQSNCRSTASDVFNF